MKKPSLPGNGCFWLSVARNQEQVNDFFRRGNDRQKKELSKAVAYLKWQQIQEQKESLCIQI